MRRRSVSIEPYPTLEHDVVGPDIPNEVVLQNPA